MSVYTKSAFKSYWGSTTGPFQNTLAATITGLTNQQLATDIADSCLFSDTFWNTDTSYFESDDFIFSGSIPRGWTSASSGAGAGVGADTYGRDATERAVGEIYAETGTTAAGYTIIYKGINAIAMGFGQALRLRQRVALETLGTGAQRYTAYVGFGDNIGSGDQNDGAYFRYNDSVNGGRWQSVTRLGGVETAVDTGVSAVTTFSIFEIQANAAGTSVGFYIDSVLKSTHTTNLPTGSGFFGLILKIEKSIGGTTNKFHMDYYDFTMNFTSTR